MDWTSILIYFLCIAIPSLIIYLYGTKNNNYWKERGIPFIKPNFLLGNFNIFTFKSTPMQEQDMIWYKQFGGKMYGGFEGTRPYLFIGDVDIIRDIVIKDFHSFPSRRIFETGDTFLKNMVVSAVGEQWKKMRHAISPTFSSGKMRMMSKLIDDCAESAILNFRDATTKDSVNVKRIFGAFTIDTIALTAFGLKIDSHKNPNNPFFQHALKAFSQNISFKFLLIFLFPKLGKLMSKVFLQEDVANFFQDVAMKIIKERRLMGKESKRVDFLQLLLDTNDDPENKGLTDNEIIANIIIFFVAGFESTSSVLSFTVYLLAQNTEHQDTLAEEIKSVLKENNGEITYDTLKKMNFLDAVVNETLRFFTPGTRIERQAAEDYKSDKIPFTIPKGMLVGFPVYAMHRDPKYFPDPEKFDPYRFMPENKDSLNLNAYLPFGSGPRNCIAMRFALEEMKHCLAKIIPKFRFSVSKDTKIPLDFYINFGGLVPKEVTLKVDVRE